MPKKDTGGVKPPLIGKVTGRLKTPLSIIAGFFALGVMLDMILEAITRYMFEAGQGLATRYDLGFKFWVLTDAPDELTHTIAGDDIVLLIITLAIGLVYKIAWKKRVYAMMGFFFGWYMSSQWLSPRVPWEGTSDTSATGGLGTGF